MVFDAEEKKEVEAENIFKEIIENLMKFKSEEVYKFLLAENIIFKENIF